MRTRGSCKAHEEKRMRKHAFASQNTQQFHLVNQKDKAMV